MKVSANGLQIEVEDSADAVADVAHKQRPVVLLIMGLGGQLVDWPDAFVQALVDSGYRVVRFDNRDIGLSTALDHLDNPKIAWTMVKLQLGLQPQPPYLLSDMAADAVGVLDALGIARAHVVGLSMGGMIAQRLSVAAPQRVLSLTSIMSSSGAKGLPGPLPHVLKVMMSHPAGQDEDAVVAHFQKFLQTVGSPAFPMPAEELRAQIQRAYRRSYRPVGTKRQMLAVVTDTGRAALLSRISCPTLVLHGRADPLVPFANAEDTARRIPGAKLLGIEGMGHDLSKPSVPLLLQALMPHLQAAQLRTATGA
jgi:pimeloyl-ACP methyl ester carboxylesterase